MENELFSHAATYTISFPDKTITYANAVLGRLRNRRIIIYPKNGDYFIEFRRLLTEEEFGKLLPSELLRVKSRGKYHILYTYLRLSFASALSLSNMLSDMFKLITHEFTFDVPTPP